jgi:predicted CxxxxCH...CXXCH cytochrome family protein
LNEANTPHRIHAGYKNVGTAYYNYDCLECHYPGADPAYHAKATYKDVFVVNDGNSPTAAAVAGFQSSAANYAADTTCTTYCHSIGAPRNATPANTYKPVKWSDGPGTIIGTATECSSCHGGLSGASVIATNAHKRHILDYNYNCQTCHGLTVNADNTISLSGRVANGFNGSIRGNHADGKKDVSFIKPANYVSAFTGTMVASATCTVSCHNDGVSSTLAPAPKIAASWTDSRVNTAGGTGYCGSCHDAAPSSNKHSQHFSSSQGPLLGTTSAICDRCHVYTDKAATHVNGSSVNDLLAGGCTVCHPSGTTTWTPTSTVTCLSCHSGATASTVKNGTNATFTTTNFMVSNFAVSRHGRSVGVNNCIACHDATRPHIGASASGEKRLIAYTGQQCDSCHTTNGSGVFKAQSSARLDLLTHSSFSHYTTTMASKCTVCHDPHSNSLYMIASKIKGVVIKPLTNISSGFIATVPDANGVYNGLCQVCHTRTNHYKKNAVGDGHNGGKNCLTCHSHRGPDYAFSGSGTCNSCHGYPPVRSMTVTGVGTLGFTGRYSTARLQNYSGGGGAHAREGHVSKTLKMYPAQGSGCTNCHDLTGTHNIGGGTVIPANVNVKVDVQFKFNKDLPITYSGVPATGKQGTCSNVSCHYQASPNWAK